MRCFVVAIAVLALLPTPRATLAAEEELSADGSFCPASPLIEARSDHTASLLPDGRVLVVGGWAQQAETPWLPSAEAWDPGTATFTPTGSLAEARVYHMAAPLPDGRVLVVGGWGGDNSALTSAEVWDSASATFAPAGTLAMVDGDTATTLSDGRVLVAGGWDPDGAHASVEIWDPATNGFDPAGSLAQARGGHTATLLSDGRVLVVGGGPGGDARLASAEVWDPATEQFSPAGTLTEARWNHTATLLSDGRVLVVGGEADGRIREAEVWDPATTTFSAAGSLTELRIYHTATLLPDGSVLVVGGWGEDDGPTLDSAELWDPETTIFRPAGLLTQERRNHTATLLADGRVLVVGGRDPDILSSAEIWASGDLVPPTCPSVAPEPSPVVPPPQASLGGRVELRGTGLSLAAPLGWRVTPGTVPLPSRPGESWEALAIDAGSSGDPWSGYCTAEVHDPTDRPARSLEQFGSDYMAGSIHAASVGFSREPVLTHIELAAGPAIQVDLDDPDGPWQATVYALRHGPLVYSLACSAPVAPVGRWRNMAESISLLDGGGVVSGGWALQPRVSLSDAGLAITLPPDWVVELPETTAVGDSQLVLAAAVTMRDTASCGVWRWNGGRHGDVVWSNLDEFADAFVSTFRPQSDSLVSVELDLPFGRAVHVSDRDPETGQHRSAYLAIDGTGYVSLTCLAERPPDDRWLSIAETIEFLSAEE